MNKDLFDEEKNEKKKKSLWDKFVNIFCAEIDLDEFDFDYDRDVLHQEKKSSPKEAVVDSSKKETPVKPVINHSKKETPVKPIIDHSKKETPVKPLAEVNKVEEKYSSEKKDNLSSDASKTILPNKLVKKKSAKQSKIKTVKKEEKDGNKKSVITPKRVIIFLASAGVVGAAGYVIANRKPEIEETNSSIIKAIDDETQIDEVFDEYNLDVEKYNTVDSNETLDTILSGEVNIVSSADKLVELINLSNALDEYDLEEALHLNGDVRSLTVDEKHEIENMSRADLLELMDQFNEMQDVDIQMFDQNAIDYSYIAMRLSYAKYIVDSQIMKYGTNLLSTYPELLIKAIIVDEANLDVSKFNDIDIKLYDGSYNACYYAPENGVQYNVVLDSRAEELIKHKEYFDTYSSKDDSFKDFKKEALKTINDCKIMLIADHDIKAKGVTENTDYSLTSSSNYSVKKKLNTLK